MRFKKSLTCALYLALAMCGAPAHAEFLSPLNLNEQKIASQVEPIYCEYVISDPKKPTRQVLFKGYGTETKVGKALVTAAHVAQNCAGNLDEEYLNHEEDLAILDSGNPGFCKDAEMGEVIVMAGYPGSDRDGDRRKKSSIKLEMEYGMVVERNKSISMLNDNGIEVTEVTSLPMDVAFTQGARPGYSGGGIFSAYDGRIVGIISAESRDGQLVWYLPISKVCDIIDQNK